MHFCLYGKVGDFAILLRAGFDRWKATRMQLSTALGGVLGASFALCSQSQHGAGETSCSLRLYIYTTIQKCGSIGIFFFKDINTFLHQ